MLNKILILITILVLLLAGLVKATENDEFEHIRYTSAEQVYRATDNYLALRRYSTISNGLLLNMILLDNPHTPEVGDAVAILKNGELEEFWDTIDGELKMVFKKVAKRPERYI